MRTPKTLILFIPQGVVLALQLFPVPGVVLLMLAAPAWAILLLNGPMVACAIEAATRPGLRRWLLLPSLWFGGYAAFVGADRIWGDWSQRHADTANAEVHAPFDPQRQSLVILGDGAEVRDVNNRAKWFVANSNIPVVYLKDQTFKDIGFAGVRLVPYDFCYRGGWEDVRDIEAGIFNHGLFLPLEPGQSPFRREFDKKVCVWSAPQKIDRPVVTAQFERAKHGGLVEVVLTSADGRSRILKGPDEAGPWPWIPLPFLGCGLGMSEWKCGFAFMRKPNWSLGKADDDLEASNDLVVQALGLKRVTVQDRRPTDPSVVRQLAGALRDRIAREQLAYLDQILANPNTLAEWHSFNNLAARPDLVYPRLASIVALMERGQSLEGAAVGYENARLVFGLVQHLPDDDLKPYRKRLEDLAARDAKFGCRFAKAEAGDAPAIDADCVKTP